MGLSHVSLHDDVGLSSEAAVETVEMKTSHPQLTVRVRLGASVESREDLEVLKFDTLQEKNNLIYVFVPI